MLALPPRRMSFVAGSVTITATDSDGAPTSTTFELVVVNVVPTIALSGAASVDEGSTYTLTLGTVTDPGADTVTSYVVDWDDGTSDTYTAGGNVTHDAVFVFDKKCVARLLVLAPVGVDIGDA